MLKYFLSLLNIQKTFLTFKFLRQKIIDKQLVITKVILRR